LFGLNPRYTSIVDPANAKVIAQKIGEIMDKSLNGLAPVDIEPPRASVSISIAIYPRDAD
jgi:hypothetical protein